MSDESKKVVAVRGEIFRKTLLANQELRASLRAVKSAYESVFQEREALRVELAQAEDSKKFSQRWWAERIERLSQWVRESHVPEEIRHQYFNIIANGTKDPQEPPTLAQLMSRAEHRAELAEKECYTLRAELAQTRANAQMFQEQAKKADDLAAGIGCEARVLIDRLYSLAIDLRKTKGERNTLATQNAQTREIIERAIVYTNIDDAPGTRLTLIRETLVQALSLPPEAPEGDDLRTRIVTMMKKRGWSLEWIHRSAYLHLEASELAEAVRGKRGDTLDESADVLITLLALSPHGLNEIFIAAITKVARLMTAPAYPGECLNTAPSARAEGPQGAAAKDKVVEAAEAVFHGATPAICGGERLDRVEIQVEMGAWLDLRYALGAIRALRAAEEKKP